MSSGSIESSLEDVTPSKGNATSSLKLHGKRVAILEAREVAGGVTGGTTAHLTQALDTRYYQLESKFHALPRRQVKE